VSRSIKSGLFSGEGGTEPGVIAIADDALRGVRLTRLKPDGSDCEGGGQAKIMIAHSIGESSDPERLLLLIAIDRAAGSRDAK
jgi:hypothetical protein